MSTSTIRQGSTSQTRLSLLLVAGDLLVLVLFAALGRASHNMTAPNPLYATLLTAWPFAAGWLVALPLAGVLGGWERMLASLRRFLAVSALTWLVGVPLGLLLRALALGRPVVLIFALVTMATTAAMLGVWRGVFWLLRRRLA